MNWLMGIVIVCAFVTLAGCTSAYSTNESGTSGVVITGTGTITYIDLEGGFYGIVDEDKSQYYPLNLAPEFAHDGMRVTYSLKEKMDAVTIFMWGVPVTILEITAEEDFHGVNVQDVGRFSSNGTVVYPNDDEKYSLIIAEKGKIYLPFNANNLTCFKEGSVISFTAVPYANNTTELIQGTPVYLLTCNMTGMRQTVQECITMKDYQNLTTVYGCMQVKLIDSEHGKEQIYLMHSGGSDLMILSEEPIDAVTVLGQYMEAKGYLQEQKNETADEYMKFSAVSLMSLSELAGVSDAVPV